MVMIDGKALAAAKHQAVRQAIQDQGLTPGLGIILANDVEASRMYVGRKMKACEDVGITPHLFAYESGATQQNIIDKIQELNTRADIHGIFLQLPVRDPLQAQEIINRIDPAKDVDGLTHLNIGRLVAGEPYLIPCTPKGVMEILGSIDQLSADMSFLRKQESLGQNNKIPAFAGMTQSGNAPDWLKGKHAVIIGRSLLFGKPMGQLLLQADCTVTHCHSKTENLPSICAQADMLIAATGQAKMVKADWVKDGAIVIDVGIGRDGQDQISGDIDYDAVAPKAAFITPVPGGVGPMTVASLLDNTVQACLAHTK